MRLSRTSEGIKIGAQHHRRSVFFLVQRHHLQNQTKQTLVSGCTRSPHDPFVNIYSVCGRTNSVTGAASTVRFSIGFHGSWNVSLARGKGVQYVEDKPHKRLKARLVCASPQRTIHLWKSAAFVGHPEHAPHKDAIQEEGVCMAGRQEPWRWKGAYLLSYGTQEILSLALQGVTSLTTTSWIPPRQPQMFCSPLMWTGSPHYVHSQIQHAIITEKHEGNACSRSLQSQLYFSEWMMPPASWLLSRSGSSSRRVLSVWIARGDLGSGRVTLGASSSESPYKASCDGLQRMGMRCKVLPVR